MTDGERWLRLRELFARAEAMSEGERRQLLAEVRAEEPDLLAELEALLAADRGAPGFLASPDDGEVRGSIGPYELLRVLGEGGFGTVYLAEQTGPLRRQVALKLIKLGMDTKQVIARFETERQALAAMNHPGIAHVFDAGTTELGRPYFVMEYVRGVPIDEYCDERHLRTRERLELFLGVCDAVQHAHQRGVIHRDLKPSNVLVATHGSSPTPKVIDFGIAKATGPDDGEHTRATVEGLVVGTIASMSPEQAGAIDAPVDTRTDIYALGALLYELLSGQPPFDPARLRRGSWTETLRVIGEEDPPPPGTRIAPENDAARRRGVDEKTLRHELRGDLERITLCALAKEPDRRYASASEFAADIRRYLANEPVLAGTPGAGYRMRKFARRNRAAVFATAAILVALLLGTAASTWGLVRALHAERKAARESAVAEAVNSFLNDDLLAAVAPSARKGRGRDVLMRDVLDAAAERIDADSAPGHRFANEPLVEASIRGTLGNTYLALGEYDAAEPHLKRAEQLQENAPPSPELARRLADLGLLYFRAGRYDESEPLYLKALEVRRSVAPDDTLLIVATKLNLAMLYQRQGRLNEAQGMYERMLGDLRHLNGNAGDRTLTCMNNLANLYQEVGRFAEAESLQTEMLDARLRTVGEEDPNTLFAMNNLANTLSSQGHLRRAEDLLVRAITLKRKTFGPEHPSTLNSMENLATLYDSLGEYARAESLHTETLTLREKVLGADHPNTQDTRNSLAYSLEKQGRYDEATALASASLKTCRERLGDSHTTTLAALLTLAFCQEGQSRLAEAEASLRGVLAGMSSADAVDPWMKAVAESHLGLVLGRRGNREEAARRLEEALPSLSLWEAEARDILRAAIGLFEQWDATDPSSGFDRRADAVRRRLATAPDPTD